MRNILAILAVFPASWSYADSLSPLENAQLCRGAMYMANDAHMKKDLDIPCAVEMVRDLLVSPSWCAQWSGPYIDKNLAIKLSHMNDTEFRKYLRETCDLN